MWRAMLGMSEEEAAFMKACGFCRCGHYNALHDWPLPEKKRCNIDASCICLNDVNSTADASSSSATAI